MHAIAPTLKPDDSGDQVANLQAALLFLLDRDVTLFLDPRTTPTADELKAIREGLIVEASAQLFDRSTRALTFAFQQLQGLDPQLNGTVEETTAKRLNGLLEQHGAVAATDAYVVEGRVVDEQGRPLSSVEVTLFDEDVAGSELIGQATKTGSDGRYRFTFSQERYLDGDYGLLVQPAAGALNHLYTAGHQPATLVIVPSGPDLWVGLGTDPKSLLARTEIVFNAGQQTRMPDLVVPRAVLSAGLSDLERVVGLVSPRLRDLSLSSLSDAQTDFLSRDCEEPIAFIRALVLAVRSDEDAGSLARNFGLARPDGLKLGVVALQFTLALDDGESRLQRLLALGDAEIMRTLEDGIARGRIPSRTADETGLLLPWLAELRAFFRLADRGDKEAASIGQVLATLPDGLRLKDAALLGVARAIDHWNTDHDQFMSAVLDAGLEDRQIHAVLRTLSLSELTGAHLPLIGLLQEVEPGPEHAALFDLAKLSRKDWTEVVTKAGLPAGVDNGPTATDTYVSTLIRGVEQRAPTAFVSARMADGRIQMEAKLLEPAARFFANNPDFRFGSDSVLLHFGKHNAIVGVEDDLVQPLLEELLRVERIARVTPSLEAAEHVLGRGFTSAMDITHRRQADFIEQMEELLPGGEAAARQIHERARSVSDTAFAIALAASPGSGRDGEIQLLSGSWSGSSQAATGSPTGSGTSATNAGAASAAQQAQSASIGALFGTQDACACDPCSAMGSPAHYLAELLMLLDRSARSSAGRTPLDVLLQRRPDIAETELDCDNSGQVVPYVDLLLELLEAPFIEDAAPNVIPRTSAIDRDLDSGRVPASLVNDFRERAGVDLGADPRATTLYSQAPGRWLVRGRGWRLLVRSSTPSEYRFRIFPQSGRAAMPESWAFPAQLLGYAYAPLALARYPWSLPFDLAREETDTWLPPLAGSLASVIEICAGMDVLASTNAAGIAIGMPPAELNIVTQTGTAATAPWRDWGFADSQVSSGNWYLPLRTVALLKRRAGISHVDLLMLIQCRFIQTSPGVGSSARLQLTGAECDSDRMLLGDPQPGNAALEPAVLRRMHLFIRLWRRLGWSMPDLDRALLAHAAPTSTTASIPPGSGSDEVLTSSFVLHLGNLVRLCQRTSLPPEMAIALFRPLLDTQTYWQQQGSRASELRSTFDRLYADPSLSRPRAPDFELDAARTALLRSPLQGEMPQLKLSDHVSVIAAGVGCSAADVLALLPHGEASIAAVELAASQIDGATVAIPAAGEVVLECIAGVPPTSGVFQIRFQASDGHGNYSDQAAAHFRLNGNPITLPLTWSAATDGWRVYRYTYDPPADQRKPQLRVQAQRTSSSGSMWLSARVITAPGLLTDELTLANLSLLTRHLLLAHACKLSGAAYRQLLEISGAQPLTGPREALELLEQVRRMRGMGLSVGDLDELLRERCPDNSTRELVQARVCEALEALRRELAADDSDLSAAPGRADVLLRKVLLEAGWPERLVERVMGDAFLGRKLATQFTAKLEVLPEQVRNRLPRGLTYRAIQKELRWDSAPNVAMKLLEQASLAMLSLFQPGDDDARKQAEQALDALRIDVEVVHDEITRSAPSSVQLFRLAQSLELPVFESAIALSDLSAVRSLVIPRTWVGTLWFDAARGQLCFRGPMSADWRDELKRLASTGAFTRAIDELFARASRYQEAAATSSFVPPNTTAATALLFGATQGSDARAQVLLRRLLPMLRLRRAKQRVLDILSPRLGVSLDVAEVLVTRYRQSAASSPRPLVGEGVSPGLLLEPGFTRSDPAVPITAAGFESQYTAVRRLFKLASVAKASQLASVETSWLMAGWPGSPGLDFGGLPVREVRGVAPAWSAWKDWTALLAARQQLGGSASTLAGYAEAVLATSPFDTTVRELASWARLRPDEVTTLVGGLGVSTIAELQVPARVQQIVACLDWLRKTGCDAASLIDWGTRPASMAGAARARQFARARLGEAAWPEASRQPLDTLRLKRREALVTEAVHRLGLRDANDLFALLLVDPEMGPCMETTRIRLAISSVQLFVQRVLLGLEQDFSQGAPTTRHVPPDAMEPREWAWMQHYRMWEANLKVLLNSENYIDMSLRREKTPPYRAVEAELMQGDISNARATAALASYLDELDQVSRLQTVGMYRDTPRNANGDPVWERETLYFVGATRTEPRKHYVRSFVKHGSAPNEGLWTPWQTIDLDLQNAYCVNPTIFEGELWLFWIDFREGAEPPNLQGNAAKGSLPAKLWEKTLRWSRRQSDKWSSPKILPLSGTEALSASHGQDVVRLLPGQTNGRKIEWKLLQRQHQIATIEVDSNEAQIRDKVISATTGRYPFHDNSLPNGLGLVVPDEYWLQVFPSVSLYRLTISYQDALAGLAFRAPRGIQSPDDIPCQFTFDSGSGELLAQPYWNYAFELFISTAQSYFALLSKPKLHFSSLHHTHAGEFARVLRKNGLNALLSTTTQQPPAPNWFSDLAPNAQVVPTANYPNLGVDFSPEGSYSAYNAELFFMIPFSVACELSKQQRFREAREWFHYVFNPTTTSATPPGSGRYWNYLPFRSAQGTASIQVLMRKLADPADNSEEKRHFLAAIAQWRLDPFDPHLVARMRPLSYQMAVVIAYLKNLIAWGDQLFRRDTMESLNEAAQLYILAAQILGRPGETIPPRTRPLIKAFSELQADMATSGRNGLSNPLVAAESILPLGAITAGNGSGGRLPQTLYFCAPANPVFKELRQTVQDRLFKIRNCMNIDGTVRRLALFEPPIDPAALVKARAAGVDVGALLSEVSSPPPIYRFSVLAQKASEVCSEVKSLGSALLSAIEKGDGEALARLRSEHELRVLANVRQLKELQIEEAKAGIEALGPSLEGAQGRLAYYAGLVSQVEDLAIPTGAAGPSVKSLATAALRTVTSTLSVVQVISGPVLAASAALLKLALTRATEAVEGAAPVDAPASTKVPMNSAEKGQLAEMQAARESQNKANDLRLVAQLFAKIPDFKLGASGIASPVVIAELGGSLLSTAASFMASMEDSRAAEHGHRATLNSMLGSYQRRAEEWTQQAKNALIDIEQIIGQVKAATIRAATAAQDLRNHDDQIANASEVDEFMRSKWSNQELYGWMSQRISSVYFRSYQLAYDLAKRAERAYRYELGLESSDFVHFGHWDGLKKGLLSGELLYHDIKRMEAAYLEANARELEITRSISLRQLDAGALIDLRIAGQSSFELPEWLFNMDYPDHYMRRIKSLSVSLPCVVGPYTGISGKLTMLSGKVRTSPTPGAGYATSVNFRASNLASSSIAVSSAQGDSGLFEFSLRDERFLPFEGGGLVDSHWRFDLPQHVRQFDYETISDLVLTVRYTARASTTLRQPAVDDLHSRLAASGPGGLLIDLKRDFPAEWSRAISAMESFRVKIGRLHFPYALAAAAEIADAGHHVWARGKNRQSWRLISVPISKSRADDTSWEILVPLPAEVPDLDELLLLIKYTLP
jgi:hypothetical protein